MLLLKVIFNVHVVFIKYLLLYIILISVAIVKFFFIIASLINDFCNNYYSLLFNIVIKVLL